jgi:hypothetical protein
VRTELSAADGGLALEISGALPDAIDDCKSDDSPVAELTVARAVGASVLEYDAYRRTASCP